MKWALALALAGLVAVVVAFVLAVGSTRDPVPDRLRACVVDGEAAIIRSDGDLGAQVRSDIGAGAVREVRRTVLGDDTAVLLRGTRYRLLVLGGRKSPPLGAGLPLRVFSQASTYALVAKETDPSQGVLADCIALVDGG